VSHGPTIKRPGTIAQVAQTYGVSTKTVRRLIARGDLHAYRFGSRLIRVDLNEAESLLRPIPTTASGGSDAA
jgi:excisionase family DNA binding protein